MNTTEQKTPDEIRRALENYAHECNGTGQFYRHMLPGILITDGARNLAEECGAYWLLDAIASWQLEPQRIPDPEWQVWQLVLDKDPESTGAMLRVSDGNHQTVDMQQIPFTDFPLPEGAELLALASEANGQRVLIIMRGCEY